MLKRLIATTLIATLCAAGPALTQQARSISDAEAKQVEVKIAAAFVDAYNAGKPAEIAALFSRDGVFLPASGTNLADHQAIEKALAARQKAGWTKETADVIEAHPLGNDILAIVDYSLIGTGENEGKQIGGYSVQWLTREGSDWRFKLIVANLRPLQDVTGMDSATTK